jgi:hypothetical protein
VGPQTTELPAEVAAAEAEPVQFVAGQLVLSESERAEWLDPSGFAGDAVALDLALKEAAGAVQPRGAHSLVVQVRRQLARIARQRRDQDRRYREARAASGNSAPPRPSWGAKAGHRSREAEAPAEAARSTYVGRPGGGYIYGRAVEDPDVPRFYALTSPEGQAYRAYCEAEGLDDDLARLSRLGRVKMRPSTARQVLATGHPHARPAGLVAGAVVARTASQAAGVGGATP